MSAQQGPATLPPQYSLESRLRDYSTLEVENTLRRLTANGELADYDDELANRVKDAADLCSAVREYLSRRT